MAIIKKVMMNFPASDSPNIVSYKLYVEESPNPVTADSENFDLGDNTSIDLSTIPGMDAKDGVFNMGVTAVEVSGNESDFSLVSDVTLDFTAPNPPGEITITYI